ncbi:hypothetical protein GCM10009558_002170 [Virgisporangium aurantiacum]
MVEFEVQIGQARLSLEVVAVAMHSETVMAPSHRIPREICQYTAGCRPPLARRLRQRDQPQSPDAPTTPNSDMARSTPCQGG